MGIEWEYIENTCWEYIEVYTNKEMGGDEVQKIENGLVDTRHKTVLFRREEEGKTEGAVGVGGGREGCW